MFAAATSGNYQIAVQVTDADGAVSTDILTITIEETPSEVELFADSFEQGSNSNDWFGNWREDSQNDFFRSTQRATDGVRSAEVDGLANDATLTLASAINISGYSSATLTFDWLIESGFDRGEFLALDVSTNGGTSWQNNVRQLRGNVDAENTWHAETVDLTPFASANLLVRFRSKVSGSSEDANIDNIRISAGNALPAALAFATLAATEPLSKDTLEAHPVNLEAVDGAFSKYRVGVRDSTNLLEVAARRRQGRRSTLKNSVDEVLAHENAFREKLVDIQL